MEKCSSSGIVEQSPRRKVKLGNLTIKAKFQVKVAKPFLKFLQVKRNFISSLGDSSAEYNLILW